MGRLPCVGDSVEVGQPRRVTQKPQGSRRVFLIRDRLSRVRNPNLVPLPANKERKSYAAIATGFRSSFWHFAMTFATDFEVQLNG